MNYTFHQKNNFLFLLLFCGISFFTNAQTLEQKLEQMKDLLTTDSINWEGVERTQIQKVLQTTKEELLNISSRKQQLEVNVISKNLRANLSTDLKTSENATEDIYSETETRITNNAGLAGELDQQDRELALLQEQEDKKKLEIAGLMRALELQAKALEVQQLRQNTFLLGGGLVLVLLTLISINLYRGNTQKKKANQLLAQEKEKTEQERDKSENLLLNILPKPVADELKTKGKASVKYYELASVIFTDFKGFTSFAEKMTPTELVGELEKCFTGFDEIMMRHGLEKIKTIGDAYMAVGGVPDANQRNPIDIVLAGLEIQRFMEQKKAKRQAQGLDYWDLRLGINSGELIAGVIGKSKFAYDVWGDTVNTASRMESSGEISKVNISGNTYALIKDFFECTHRGKINAKNKGEIDMYFVERVKPELSEQGQGRVPSQSFWDLMKQKGLLA